MRLRWLIECPLEFRREICMGPSRVFRSLDRVLRACPAISSRDRALSCVSGSPALNSFGLCCGSLRPISAVATGAGIRHTLGKGGNELWDCLLRVARVLSSYRGTRAREIEFEGSERIDRNMAFAQLSRTTGLRKSSPFRDLTTLAARNPGNRASQGGEPESWS
jgi:hypothetical protein